MRDSRERVRDDRHDSIVTGWQIRVEQPGYLKLRNPVLFRKKSLCNAIDNGELTGVLGIDRFSANSLTCIVKIEYDTGRVPPVQAIETLDAVLAGAENPAALDKLDLHLPICTASIPLAAYAQFVAPGALPVAAALYAYTDLEHAQEERGAFSSRKNASALISSIRWSWSVAWARCRSSPGAVCCWCLSFGRVLVKMCDDSKKLFVQRLSGKQPRTRRLAGSRGRLRSGSRGDTLQKGDRIVVHTGRGRAG